MHCVSAHSVVLLFLPLFFPVDCASFFLLAVDCASFLLSFCLYSATFPPPWKSKDLLNVNIESGAAVCCCFDKFIIKAKYWEVIMMNNLGKIAESGKCFERG